MQVPISPMILRGLHALTWKFATEVLVSSLATLLVMAVFSHVTKPASPMARDDGRLTSLEGRPAAGKTSESSETADDFVERVALSHIASLKAPASQTAIVAVAASEPAAEAGAPLPPRLPATLRHDRPSASKVHVAASVPKVLPPPPPATIEPPIAVAAPAPVLVKAEPLPPLQYGMRLVSNIGTIISVSQTRVVQSVASVGDTLTSLAKKL